MRSADRLASADRTIVEQIGEMSGSGIDSFFDLAERTLDAIGAPPLGPRQATVVPSARTQTRAARSSSAPAPAPGASSNSTSLAVTAREFRVVDAIDAQTGSPSWVVTNGRDRAECSSRDFAERVRTALG